MYVIKKVNISGLAKLSGVVSALIGLIPAFFSSIAIVFSIMAGAYWSIFSLAPLFFAIVIPLIAGVAGYVWGLLAGFIYNKLAEHGYGLEIEIEMIEYK